MVCRTASPEPRLEQVTELSNAGRTGTEAPTLVEWAITAAIVAGASVPANRPARSPALQKNNTALCSSQGDKQGSITIEAETTVRICYTCITEGEDQVLFPA